MREEDCIACAKFDCLLEQVDLDLRDTIPGIEIDFPEVAPIVRLATRTLVQPLDSECLQCVSKCSALNSRIARVRGVAGGMSDLRYKRLSPTPSLGRLRRRL